MDLREIIKNELEKKEIKLNIIKKNSSEIIVNHIIRRITQLIPDTFTGLKIKNQIFNLGYIGNNCAIRDGFRYRHGKNIYLMDNTFVNYDCLFLDSDLILIGSDVNFGPHVNIYTIDHEMKKGKLLSDKKPVFIKNNVWIGGNSTILPGVCIGEYSIIGAGSVVNKSVEPYSLYVGSPARKIKDLK